MTAILTLICGYLILGGIVAIIAIGTILTRYYTSSEPIDSSECIAALAAVILWLPYFLSIPGILTDDEI